jgi:hypothetical protein
MYALMRYTLISGRCVYFCGSGLLNFFVRYVYIMQIFINNVRNVHTSVNMYVCIYLCVMWSGLYAMSAARMAISGGVISICSYVFVGTHAVPLLM